MSDDRARQTILAHEGDNLTGLQPAICDKEFVDFAAEPATLLFIAGQTIAEPHRVHDARVRRANGRAHRTRSDATAFKPAIDILLHLHRRIIVRASFEIHRHVMPLAVAQRGRADGVAATEVRAQCTQWSFGRPAIPADLDWTKTKFGRSRGPRDHPGVERLSILWNLHP